MTPVRTTHTYLLIMHTVRAAYYVYESTVLIFMHRSDDDDFTTVCILK